MHHPEKAARIADDTENFQPTMVIKSRSKREVRRGCQSSQTNVRSESVSCTVERPPCTNVNNILSEAVPNWLSEYFLSHLLSVSDAQSDCDSTQVLPVDK